MDYNIYIRNETGGTQSPAKPWKDTKKKEAMPEADDADFRGGFKKALGSIKGASLSGLGKIDGAVVAPIAGIALMKAGFEAMKFVDSFASVATGDYSLTHTLGNISNGMSVLFSPLSTASSALKESHSNAIHNVRQAAQRELLGDSLMTSLSKRL